MSECKLSLCDCRCHPKGATLEETEGVLCGINCLGEYGVSDCTLYNGSCTEVHVQTTTAIPATTMPASIECTVNADCGINGTTITKNHTCINADVYKQYIRYRCSKPGTPEAKCIGTSDSELLIDCQGDTRCTETGPYCRYVNPEEESKAIYYEAGHWAGYEEFYARDTAYRNYTGYSIKLNEILYANSGYYGLTLNIMYNNTNPHEVLMKKYEKTTYWDLTIGLSSIISNETDIIAEMYIKSG